MKIKLILVIFLFAGLIGCSHTNKVCFKNNCFEVELAVTEAQHTQGLMFRKNLDWNKGMLFIFQKEGRYNFWMKNTFIPLDIIWINKNKEVVFIKEDARPCKQDSCPAFEPVKEAKYVLELNAGKASNIGLKKGDKLDFFLSFLL